MSDNCPFAIVPLAQSIDPYGNTPQVDIVLSRI